MSTSVTNDGLLPNRPGGDTFCSQNRRLTKGRGPAVGQARAWLHKQRVKSRRRSTKNELNEEDSVRRALVVALILLSCSGSAAALCKYKAADGSWTYAKSCAPMSEKEIDQSANAVLKKNAAGKKTDAGVEVRRLRGFEYSDTTHSGMRIRMVEPNKSLPVKEFTPE